MPDPARHPLAGGGAPAWADEWGEDEHGPWAAFRLGDTGGRERGVAQRFRWVPPGEAWLGSPPEEWGRSGWEWPRTRWRLEEGFWLGEVPCTRALWAAVMGEPPPASFAVPTDGSADEWPQTDVSFEDAQAFLEALARRDPELRFELPTEARWEYACRAGRWTATYAGDLVDETTARRVLDPIAWVKFNTGSHPEPVGRKAANGWGLREMLGSVWEWCSDVMQTGGTPQSDPEGPRTEGDLGSLRVLRGGAWRRGARDVRAAHRYAYRPGFRYAHIGFRLSRGPSAPGTGRR